MRYPVVGGWCVRSAQHHMQSAHACMHIPYAHTMGSGLVACICCAHSITPWMQGVGMVIHHTTYRSSGEPMLVESTHRSIRARCGVRCAHRIRCASCYAHMLRSPYHGQWACGMHSTCAQRIACAAGTAGHSALLREQHSGRADDGDIVPISCPPHVVPRSVRSPQRVG